MAKTTRASKIVLYKDVPFDSFCNDIMFFDTPEHQEIFWGVLNGWRYRDLVNLQAVFDNTRIKLNVPYEEVLNVNYMRFINPDFGNKWFYGFITRIDYVSNGVTEFTVIPDVFQTHMFDIEFDESTHIVRQVVPDDAYGKYTIEELNVTSDLVYSNFTAGEITDEEGEETTSHFVPDSITILSTADPYSGSNIVGGEYEGVYSGAKRYTFDSVSGVNGALSGLNTHNKSASVVSMCMTPSAFISADGKLSRHYIQFDTSRFTNRNKRDFVIPDYNFDVSTGTVDHYKPQNNKSLQYPYVSLYMTDFQGNDAVYKIEDFFGAQYTGKVAFNEIGTFNGTFEGGIYPLNYQGIQNNYGKMMPVKCGVPCCWTYDAFQAELAEKYASYRATADALIGGLKFVSDTANTSGSTVAKKVTSTLSPYIDKGEAIASAVSGGKRDLKSLIFGSTNVPFGYVDPRFGATMSAPTHHKIGTPTPDTSFKGQIESGLTSAFTTVAGVADTASNFLQGVANAMDAVASSILSYMHSDALPLSCNGSPQPSLMTSVAGDNSMVHFYIQHVRPQILRHIDRYFTLYGYAVNAYGKPVLNGRFLFDYLQTDHCHLKRKAGAKITQEELDVMGTMFDSGVRLWHVFHSDTAHANPTSFSAFNNFLERYRCVFVDNSYTTPFWQATGFGYIDRYGEPTDTKPTDWR